MFGIWFINVGIASPLGQALAASHQRAARHRECGGRSRLIHVGSILSGTDI
jgi:hypothetical protein